MKRIRKQIYLDRWQEERLAELARKSSISEAEIVRKALEEYFLVLDQLPAEHPLSHLAGMGRSKNGDAGASDHDAIIYKCGAPHDLPSEC